ncbi:MAG: hypothetical protein K6G76_02295 [Lachnospiraceae bacterium]|nr:hypothetical protein [Lachnospiraceae bacterium]
MRKISGLLMVMILALVMCGCSKESTRTTDNGKVPKTVDDVLANQTEEADIKDSQSVDLESEGTQAPESQDADTQQSDDMYGDTEEAPSDLSSDDVDVDLTKLSSTLVYSEVYTMMCAPEQYIGKKIRMKGTTAIYHDDVDNNDYYACVIKDATACCAQGIEFQLSAGDYPTADSEITVSGIFSSYKIEEDVYYTLKDAVIE